MPPFYYLVPLRGSISPPTKVGDRIQSIDPRQEPSSVLLSAHPGSFAGPFISGMNNLLIALAILTLTPVSSSGQSSWRQATEKELASILPPRAQVEKERIETELRTASGITDGKGKFIAGVVLITAGYA